MKLNFNLTVFFCCIVVQLAYSSNSLAENTLIPSEVGTSEFHYVISKKCTYEIGILYMPKQGGINTIKEIIGPPSAINLPAIMNIFIANSNGVKVFEKNQFGGQGLGYRYGPPIKLIAGKLLFTPGTYLIQVEQTSITDRMSAFKAYFFIDKIPKTICGK